MIGSKNDASIGQSGLNVTPNTGFMFALFRDGCVGTPIVNRKRAGTHQVGESSKCGGVGVFHDAHFSLNKPINANQLCGASL